MHRTEARGLRAGVVVVGILLTTLAWVPAKGRVPANSRIEGTGPEDGVLSDPPHVWDLRVVDAVGDVGRGSSLALDAWGRPHISYNDFTNRDVKYAHRVSGRGWNISVVDSGDVRDSSLRLDTLGWPHLTYRDNSTADLKYAHWDGGGWVIEDVDTVGDTGWYSSLALYEDRPHVSYMTFDSGYALKYAFWDGSEWKRTTVDSDGNVGLDTSLAMDSSGRAQIAYLDLTNFDLKYAAQNGSGWDISVVDSVGDVGTDADLALDALDRPHVSYQDFGNLDLKYAWRNGTEWHRTVVDSDGEVGRDTSIALDASGSPRIAYNDFTRSRVKFAAPAGSGWIIEVVDGIGKRGVGASWGTSLAMDATGMPRISYFEGSSLDLKYARWNRYPSASFEVVPPGNPPSGSRQTFFEVNASSSVDPEDPAADLEVRWDWEDDGFWDTPFTTNKTDRHRYSILGTHTIRLEVRDPGNLTDQKTRQVRVRNAMPVADAGPDQVAHRNAWVSLNGSGSSDDDGDPLNYQWRQVLGTHVDLTGADEAVASFTPTELGDYAFRLGVGDGAVVWSNTTSVETTGSGSNRGPRIALGPEGKAVAVWLHGDEDGETIWSNRYAPELGWELDWDNATRVPSKGYSWDERPQVAMNGAGDAVAAFSHWDGISKPLWASLYVPGGGWSPAAPIQTDQAVQSEAQVAIDRGGNALAVWIQGDRVWAADYEVASGLWDAPLTIDNASGYWLASSSPSIAMDPAGNAVVAWEQSNYYCEWDEIDEYCYLEYYWTEIWASNYTAGSWGTPILISPEDWTAKGDNTRVAMDSAGNALAVWDQNGGIWANRFVPGSGWEENATQINETSNGATTPAVAFDGSGNAIAIWSQRDDSTWNIWANRYNATTEDWGTAEMVELDDAYNSSFDPVVGMDEAGNALALWHRSGSGYRVWVTLFNGTDWGDPELVGSETDPASLYYLDLNVSPAGNATIVGSRFDGLRWSLWATRYAPELGWENLTQVDLDGSEDEVRPTVAMDDMGNAFVLWEEWEDTPGIRASGSIAGGDWTIAHPFETEPVNASWDVRVAASAAGALAVWIELGMVFANRYLWPSGWGTASVVQGFDFDGGWGAASDPDVALDEGGNGVAAWMKGDRIWTSRYDAASGLWDVPVTLDNASGYWYGSSSPSVAMDPMGNAVVTWQQSNYYCECAYDYTEYYWTEIWASNYTAGSWGTPILISPEDWTAKGDNTRVAMDSAGNALAVWDQNGGIWANRFVPGSGWENATRINPGPHPARQPRLGIDASGNATAVWMETRGSSFELWTSRYVPGEAGWRAAEPVERELMSDAFELAVEQGGNAVVVWRRDEDAAYSIWARHYAGGIGWNASDSIDAGTGDAASPHVGVDTEGNAVVVWARSNGANQDILAARLEPAYSYDDVTVTVVNRAPVANAGSDIPVYGSGRTVHLNGTGSFDPDGDAFSYRWTQTAGPTWPPLNNETTARPDFIPPLVGVYTFELRVADLYGANDTDTVRIIVGAVGPPIAVAAASSFVDFLLVPITFDATGSIDDNGITRYLWEFGDGSNDTNVVSTHGYAYRGAFTVTLTVWDAENQSDTDNLTIQIVNRPPVASASVTPPPIRIGQTIVLDGTGSTDADGDTLSYRWNQTGGPRVNLTGEDEGIASFVPIEFATYKFELTVSDGVGGSDVASVTITAPNRNPVADAGPDQPAAAKRVLVTLDATASSDPDGDPLTFRWTPPEEIALSDTSDPTPTFTAATSGTYTFLLLVEDGLGGTATDTMTVTVINSRPVASASAPASAAKHTLVVLDGSTSSDSDGDPLVYHWKRVSGPSVSIGGDNTAIASFTPELAGTYVFELTVDDGDVGGADAVRVSVIVLNRPPIASASAPPSAAKHMLVVLNGSSSYDPDGDLLAYSWKPVGPSVSIGRANTATASFTPDRSGTYVFELTVDDGDEGGADSARVTVTVLNARPVALASAPPAAPKHAPIRLNGSASWDPDGDALIYWWIQESGHPATIDADRSAVATFTPHRSGTYSFTLVVDDRDVEGRVAARVTVTVSNAAPLAGAGEDVVSRKLVPVRLSGSAFDADGDALTISWSWVGPSDVILSGAATLSPEFIAPAVGQYLFRLDVTDPEGAVATDYVTVTVWGLAPTAILTASATAAPVGASILFDGSGSHDPDGTIVEYTFDFGDRTRPSRGREPTWAHAFPAEGIYIVSLVVRDDDGNVSARSSAKVTVLSPSNFPPIAAILASPSYGPLGTVFTFDASASSDDRAIVAYAWDFGDGTSSTGLTTTHSYAWLGAFTVTLTVTDDTGLQDTATASVVVWVQPTPRDTLPPAITIVFPRPGAELSEGSITVRGNAWDNVGVVAVKVSLDGVAWLPAHGTTEWSATLVLEAGSRTIYARAFDAAGNDRFASVTIFVAGEEELRPPSGDPIIIEIVIVIGIVAAALWRFRSIWVPYIIFWLYTKLRRDEVLDNFARGQIYGFIRLNPGESYSAIKRSLGMASGSVTYHLAVLEREHLIRSVARGSRKLFYSYDVRVPENGDDLRALRERILRVVRQEPGMAVSDLAETLGVSRHVALYHVRKLAQADLAVLERRMARLRVYPEL